MGGQGRTGRRRAAGDPGRERGPAETLARRSAHRARFGAFGGAAGLVALAAFGCASTRVSNLDAYGKVPMNKVVPYPSKAELRHRADEIVVVDRPSVGIDDSTVSTARAQVRRRLEEIAADAGAVVIDRSLQSLNAVRTEGVLSELDGEESDVSGADLAIASRFSKYRYFSTWKPPFQFLWQTADDVAGKPGTCTHTAEIELDVQVIEIGRNDRVRQTFALSHSNEQQTKDLDRSCPIAPVTLSVLFENTLDEAMSCLDLPLGSMLLPRGHVTAHRKAKAADRHIYRISLGATQGIERGGTIEIRRQQRSMSPSGDETRSERVIATGVVTDQVMPEVAWVAIDPSQASEEILEGDVARPVLSEGLLSSLSGPSCEHILDQR